MSRSILLAVAVSFAGGVLAGEPVRLGKAEVESGLPGKTLNYANVNGSTASVSFSADGRVSYRTGNSKASIGTWTVEDNGRYCIKFSSGMATDHCRQIWKTDSGYATGTGKGDNLMPLSGFE